MRWGTVLVVAAGLWACDDETSGPRLIGRQDASERDARPVGDAATRDAAPADVGPGGGPDGGRDAQVPDSTVQFDAAGVDLGARDRGGEDRGPPPDAAILDAAPPPDQALPDVGPVARCGDGQVDEGEACDDGNALDGDYCAGDCRAVTGRCGDGVLQNIERCDDGRLVEGCDATHDGGDGTCLPPGQCSADFVLDGADCVARQQSAVVDIFVDNFCNMRVEPPRFAVAPGRTVSFTYRNRSVDYPVDVWLSYGGGFLDLETGTQWADRFVHCTGARRPYQAAADISTACSEHRFIIDCQ
ncbi:MAG: hypothetical protein R3F60_06535 [bacterium]